MAGKLRGGPGATAPPSRPAHGIRQPGRTRRGRRIPRQRRGAACIAIITHNRLTRSVLVLIAFAPLFFVFEVWQLVLSERYLGIKQIARGADPRQLGLRETTAFFWSMLIVGYWFWMLLLLTVTFSRAHGIGLLLVSMTGFSLRRGARFKWLLVILTFEGAIRVGLLLSLCAMAWRRMG